MCYFRRKNSCNQPWSIEYKAPYPFHFLFTNIDILIEFCGENNSGSSCATTACIVEMSFVIKIYELSLSGGQLDTKLMHPGRSQEYSSSNCPVKDCLMGEEICKEEKVCCGDYPNRKPFRHFSGTRACCGGKVFDTGFLMCCEDDKIATVC